MLCVPAQAAAEIVTECRHEGVDVLDAVYLLVEDDVVSVEGEVEAAELEGETPTEEIVTSASRYS